MKDKKSKSYFTKIAKLKELGRKYKNRKWYKDFCAKYDTIGSRASVWLKQEHKSYFKKVAKYSYYVKGKSGVPMSADFCTAFRFPLIANECKMCKSPTSYSASSKSWSESCSVKCAAKVSVAKREANFLKKYGVKNPSQVEKFKKKRANTNLKKFGVKNAFQSEKIKDKIRQTISEKYGVDNVSKSASIKKKKIETSLKNFGTEYWAQSEQARAELSANNPMYKESVKDKLKQTNMKRYGVENAGVISGKNKRVYDIFGNSHLVQGYEHIALAYLNAHRRIESIESRARKIPVIKYKKDGVYKQYYPDFLVKINGINHLIEVKSLHTLTAHLETNLLKFKAATKRMRKKDGVFHVYLIDRFSKIVKIKNPTQLSDFHKKGFLLD